jgi:flagellar biosynthesis protein FliR
MDTAGLEAWYAAVPMGLLVFARIGGMFVAGPVIGGNYVPLQARALIALAITLLLTPMRLQAEVVPLVNGSYVLLLAKEVLVGLSLGFFVNLFISGIRFGGDLANRHAGFSAAESFDPDTDSASSPVGDLYHVMAVMVFLLLDGHHVFIAAIARSYSFIPSGGYAPGPDFVDALSAASNQMFLIALALSFPVLGAVMVITVAEAVIVRAVPQINFLHFGFAVKILVSLLVLWAGVPAAVGFMGVVVAGARSGSFALLKVMGGA